MTRNVEYAVVLGLVVVLAGCAGTPGGVATGTDAGTPPGPTGALSGAGTDAAVVHFYISDEENAIGDFRQLNVTVTRIGFERAAAEGGGWVEREVDNATVDLTELQGSNATLVNSSAVPNGTYSKVFVHVSEVNATLQTGEQVRVKLPSEKLQLEKSFTVSNGSEVDFVFDITVHKAGNSGKYILKPVVSESGTDVPINPVDDEERREGLNLQFVGNISQGENATVEVIQRGAPVANATVLVNDEPVGVTDADGRLTFMLPADEKVTVQAKKDDHQAELKVEFHDGGEEDVHDADESDDNETVNVTFTGNVTRGENATLVVTRNGSAVTNATVSINDERVGTTNATGELTVAIPDTDTVTVRVQAGDAETELEFTFESASESESDGATAATPDGSLAATAGAPPTE